MRRFFSVKPFQRRSNRQLKLSLLESSLLIFSNIPREHVGLVCASDISARSGRRPRAPRPLSSLATRHDTAHRDLTPEI